MTLDVHTQTQVWIRYAVWSHLMFCIMSCFRVNMGMMERLRVFPVLRDWPWVLFTLKICAFQCEVIGNIHNFKRVCVYLGTCGKAWRQRWTGRSWICGEIHSAVLKALLFIHLWTLLPCFVTHNHIKKKMQGWFRFTMPWQPPLKHCKHQSHVF